MRIGWVVALLILTVFAPMAVLLANQIQQTAAAKLEGEVIRVRSVTSSFTALYRVMLKEDLIRLQDIATRVQDRGTEECNDLLARELSGKLHYANLVRVSADGFLTCSGAELNRSINITDRGYFRRAMQKSAPFSSELVVGRMSGLPLQMQVVPLRTSDGAFDGVLLAGFRLDWLAGEVLNSRVLGDSAEHKFGVTFFDRMGRMQYSNPPTSYGGDPLRLAANGLLQSSSETTIVRTADESGVARIYALTELDPEIGVFLSVSVPETEAFLQAEYISENRLLALSIGGGLILLVALAVGHFGLVRPIRTLRQDAAGLAQSERYVLPDRLGPREVQDLRATLRDLGDSLAMRGKKLGHSNAELRRTNKELTDFTHAAGSDLQVPVKAMDLVLTELERRDQLPPSEQRSHIASARDALNTMQRMINNVLIQSDLMQDVSRPRDMQLVDVNEVLLNVREELTGEIREAGADIRVGELPSVIGDSALLTELFQNLVSNGIRFAKQGQAPQIRVWQSVDDDPDWVVINVEDRGIGIDPKDHRAVFEPFRRLREPGQPGGSGVGLGMCSRIASRHDGEIAMTSAPDQGTTFHLRLPASRLVSSAARKAG